jgi:hypothetical protein
MTIRKTFYLAIALSALACDRQKSSESEQSATIGAPSSAPAPAIARDARGMSKGYASGAAVQSVSLEGQESPPPVVPAQPEPAMPSMMIRTGYATVEVSKIDTAVIQVRALAAKYGGYITNSSSSGGRDQVRAAMLEIRIPAPRYDEAVAALASIGRVESTQTNAQDVGEEFVDVTARVENARKLEARLVELLANRTGRLQDVLSVERELSRVRTEIDQLEGRIRYLKNRVALSTLTVNLHEPQPLIGNTPGENPIGAAVRKAWKNFVGFFASLIASLGVLVPLAAIGAVIWFLIRKKVRKGV